MIQVSDPDDVDDATWEDQTHTAASTWGHCSPAVAPRLPRFARTAG